MLRVVAVLAALAVASCSSHEGGHDKGMGMGGMDVTFNNYASGGPMMGGMMGMKGMGMGMGYGGYDDWEDWMEYWMGDHDEEEDDMTAHKKNKMRTLDNHEGDDDEEDEMMMKMMMYGGSGPMHYYYFISHMMEECHEHVEEAVHELHMHNMASMVGMFCDLYLAACNGVGTSATFDGADAVDTSDDLTVGRFDDAETCMATKMGIWKWATADWDKVGECMGSALMDAIELGNSGRVAECEMAAAAGDCMPTHMYPEWDMEDMEDMMMM